MLWVRISIRMRCTTLCDKFCQRLATGQWFSPGTPVSFTNKTYRHDIAEILLKVALNIIKQTNQTIYPPLKLFISEIINFSKLSKGLYSCNCLNLLWSTIMFSQIYIKFNCLKNSIRKKKKINAELQSKFYI
jgi:hypothetical protein